ncbi:MAG: hypothetical protein ACOYYU_14005 [Chloroflexota bacterium]
MKTKVLLLPLSLLLLLACRMLVPVSQTQIDPDSSQAIGFDFSGQTPQTPTGDRSAATHLFVHKYPFPSSGSVTGVTFLNDSDGGAEMFTLLILRPGSEGWQVIHRVDIEGDDLPPAKTGITSIRFGTPLEVHRGDLFAHWQPDDTGPIPMNDENSSVEGLSFGKVGFSSEDIEEGQFILNQGFSGGRDYFINLVFEETP